MAPSQGMTNIAFCFTMIWIVDACGSKAVDDCSPIATDSTWRLAFANAPGSAADCPSVAERNVKIVNDLIAAAPCDPNTTCQILFMRGEDTTKCSTTFSQSWDNSLVNISCSLNNSIKTYGYQSGSCTLWDGTLTCNYTVTLEKVE
jgi:hypothetical protein